MSFRTKSPGSKNRSVARLWLEPLEDRSLPAPFTAGNLVIYRIGDGSATLNAAATAVFLDEYQTTGLAQTPVQSIAAPTADSGSNQTLTASWATTGTATAEGLLTRSVDGQYLIFTGYDAATGTTSVATSSSLTTARVVGRVAASGIIDTSTTTTGLTASIRGATSTNGTDIWLTGSTGGVIYTTFGGSGAGTAVSTAPSNLRAVSIFDGQLYISTQSGSTIRIGSVGTGTPTTAGQTITNIPGGPTSVAGNGFFFADLSSSVAGVDTLYIADVGEGIHKYSLTSTGGNWGSNSPVALLNVSGITGVVNGSTVSLYATTPTSLVSLTDSTGHNGSVLSLSTTTLATATTNTTFRGVAFAPVAPAAPTAGTPTVTNATTVEDIQSSGGLVITASTTSGDGTTHYKVTGISNGTLYQNDGTTAISNGTFITKSQGAAGLKFTPASNLNSPGSVFSFKVQASTTNTDAGLGGSEATATITVNSVNDAPSGANKTVTTNENTAFTFAAADFGFTDPNDSPANTLLAVKIATLPALGTLTNNGSPVTAGASISVADLNGGLLVFTPATNASGSPFTTFTFQVQDAGGTASTGVDLDQTPNTITINVTAVADNSPVITSNGAGPSALVNVAENTTAVTTVTATDADIPAQTFTYSLSGADALKFNISTSGVLTFVTAPDFESPTDAGPNNVYDVIVTVTDSGSPALTDTQALAVAVTAVNDNAPVIASNGAGPSALVNVAENMTAVTTVTQTDTDMPAQTFTYSLSGTDALKFSISTSGVLTFATAPDFENPTDAGPNNVYDVTVTVTDSGSPSLADSQTLAVTVTNVNDVPAGVDKIITATEDVDYVFSVTDFLLTDANDSPANTLAGVKLASLPALGVLRNNGVPLLAGDTVSLAGITVGNFTYRGALNGNGSPYTTFTFQVQDNGGTSNGGIDLDPTPNTITVNVTPVNDEPSFTASNPPAVDEDALPQTVTGFVSVFSPGPANESGQTVSSYAVGVTGMTGNLMFTTAPAIDPSGVLTYEVAPNTNGTATIEVTVTDSGSGTAPNANTTAAQTFMITVTAINDEPSVTLASSALTVAQDSGAFSQNGFATFAPGGGADEVGQTPTYTLTNTNNALFSSQPTIDATGSLAFATAPGASGTAVVTVNVMDSGSNAAPNDNTGAPNLFTIIVTPAPVVTAPAVRAQLIVMGTDAGTPATVHVLDATTHAVVREIVPFAGFMGGVRVALGDVNGDDRDDVIVGTATGGSHVKVFDGVSGAEVQSFFAFEGFTGGIAVAAGDVNGDGRDDVIVGTATGASHVKVFDGVSGAVVQSFFAFEGFTGGVKVAAGDVNGDGKADIAVLAGPGGNGHVKVFDAVSSVLVGSFLGYTSYTGEIDLAVGDVTGDGFGEVITTAQNPTEGTHVKAFDTQGETVRSFFAPTTVDTVATEPGFRRTATFPVAPTGNARVGAADLDGDRVADYLLVSVSGTGTSQLVLVNGATGVTSTESVFDALDGIGVYVDVN